MHEDLRLVSSVLQLPRYVLLGVLVVVGLGVEGLDAGLFGADGFGFGAGLAVVRGGSGT